MRKAKYRTSYSWFFALQVLLNVFQELAAIRILELKVPTQVMTGDSVVLNCIFDLEGQTLYSLNWWLNNTQFYQFDPSEEKQQIIYETPGVRVDKAESSMRVVTLRNVTKESSGDFKCEIVSDFPSYERDSLTAPLKVVEIPRRPPIIYLEQSHYHVGETLRANCTSKGTKPPPIIRWYLNGKKVHSKYVHRFHPSSRRKSEHNVDQQRHHRRRKVRGTKKKKRCKRNPHSLSATVASHIFLLLKDAHFTKEGRSVLTCSIIYGDIIHSATNRDLTIIQNASTREHQSLLASVVHLLSFISNLT